MNAKYKQWLIASAPLVFVLLWSTGYLSSRILRPYIEPLTFSAIRFAAASLILIALVRYRQAPWPTKPITWMHLSICGVLIQGFFITGMMVAVNVGLDMGIAALVGGMQPILTAVLAICFLREEVSHRQHLGFGLGFLGLALVLYQSINLGNLPLEGLIISFLAVAGITFGTLYQKKYMVEVNLLSGTTVQFIAASVPVGALAMLLENGNITWNVPVIITAVWLIVAQSIGAVLILFAMIKAGAVSKVSSLFYLVPPLCAVQGYVFFNERLTPVQLMGILLASLGVIVINRVATPQTLRDR
ncbi:MAG: DMT family transporter [Gammaproteobacteria bacterium]